MKTQIFNLIILDESGSMDCIRQSTISGCNETLNTIRGSQKQFGKTQEHFVSIFAFQSAAIYESRYLVENMPVNKVRNITVKDYKPYGCTPLYDAVGATLTDLERRVRESPLALGSVTIITDGMENASRHYSLGDIVRRIEALKELGWNFNFIGANIDVEGTARVLKIDNAYRFEQTEAGTKEMFKKMRSSGRNYSKRLDAVMDCCSIGALPMASRAEILKEASAGYFEEDNVVAEGERMKKLTTMAKRARRG